MHNWNAQHNTFEIHLKLHLWKQEMWFQKSQDYDMMPMLRHCNVQ